MFPTKHNEILNLIDQIDPIRYAQTRNYIDGAVTRLSPYISRGILSTKQIAQAVLSKGYQPYQIDSFLKELTWRDYFQQVWIARKDEIDQDLKQQQEPVVNYQIASAILNYQTGIHAIDQAIEELYRTGYMHNHLRMYVAGLSCNLAQNHWRVPAKWMYYHLLDADWASNALSWQWVAGAFSSKKYYANQENINRYCYTHQQGTFLDVSYDEIGSMPIPEILQSAENLTLKTYLPSFPELVLDKNLPCCIYNFYNLDVNWSMDFDANQILLLEPSFFDRYPVSDKTIDFVLDLATNIPNIQVFVGEFNTLKKLTGSSEIHYKEHPTNVHYQGTMHTRDWIFDEVKGYYPSFFSYWKKCEKYLKNY
ncbi:deoxyribodipyrimidine photolyase [Flavobacterium sp. CYK-4]|uniref:FAD-binding domain-containing protein n=1 Tax=Flavobacterium lotistagni TaxID=2709660 RepID=UPI00140A093E|nr:FAD-binding domain-containing protein [Flavobacterium lotistagni]NHM07515.1 deoxyribodipyrimidine photolyase [Flavobacterium lotistagni]